MQLFILFILFLDMLSKTEEDYIKSLLHLTIFSNRKDVGTNELAANLGVKPATVSDMLKKLKEKELIDYKKYGKISMTDFGKKTGMDIIRKHRLWETFLCQKLGFSWDEVHEVAEQLEHIHSQKLIDSLDEFLGFPKYDPHGDVIPTKQGDFSVPFSRLLSDIPENTICKIIAVTDDSTTFLQYADKIGIKIGLKIEVTEREDFDQLISLNIGGEIRVVSQKFSDQVFVVIEGDKGF